MKTPKFYPSNLTDEQWQLIRPLLPKAHRRDRRRSVDRRRLLDALFYLLRTGCPWRQLPHDFPPWGTVAAQFHHWRTSSLWQKIHHALYSQARQQAGKQPKSTE